MKNATESNLKIKAKSVAAYLRGVTTTNARHRVRQAYRRRLADHSLSFAGMNRPKRELLHDAVFEVEDHYESRNGGRPDHPVVVALNAARNHILDDLGWNDHAPSLRQGYAGQASLSAAA